MRAARFFSDPDEIPRALANFDSTTAFVRALGRYLHGEGFPRIGMLPRPLATVMPVANWLPQRSKQWLYTKSGSSEAVLPETLADVDVDAFRQWVVDRYPERGYPAVLVGSPNGAAIHLAALLGIPWLPQTFLIPVRRSLPPGAAVADLEWGRDHSRPLLAGNPDIQLHQMHDPNQDRLMVREVAYFRLKLRRLGAAYEQFLESTLAPGGRIIVVDCDSRWLTTRVDDRYCFQFGGLGGLEPTEYLEKTPQVERFLARQGEPESLWNPPAPDSRSPEAEWGFESRLHDDITRFADEQDYRVLRLSFDGPRGLSGLVAELYRQRYAKHGVDGDRLLVGNFTLLDPWWTLRTGSVPFWLPFNADADAEQLGEFLDDRRFDEIYLMLFSNGIEAAGQAPVDRWRELLGRARTRGDFVGVDTDAYPLDFGTYVRYHSRLSDVVQSRQPLLPPLDIDEFVTFMNDRYRGDGVELTGTQ